MSRYEAPAKLNLSLLVSPPRPDGLHPLQSWAHTVEWCDLLEVSAGEERTDTVESEIEDDLVERALSELRKRAVVPSLAIEVVKEIPISAGLGGGSADAAAALMAGADFAGLPVSKLPAVASRVGADVSLFLTGGSVIMGGVGDEIVPTRQLEGFAMAVVVPEFGLGSEDVYRRWDALEGPKGWAVADEALPPALRGGMPMRNDLLPAALDIEPRLGDFMADVSSAWATAVCLTGSGSACFGYFATLDEASDAAAAVSDITRAARGVTLRDHGVARLENGDPDAS